MHLELQMSLVLISTQPSQMDFRPPKIRGLPLETSPVHTLEAKATTKPSTSTLSLWSEKIPTHSTGFAPTTPRFPCAKLGGLCFSGCIWSWGKMHGFVMVMRGAFLRWISRSPWKDSCLSVWSFTWPSECARTLLVWLQWSWPHGGTGLPRPMKSGNAKRFPGFHCLRVGLEKC